MTGNFVVAASNIVKEEPPVYTVQIGLCTQYTNKGRTLSKLKQRQFMVDMGMRIIADAFVLEFWCVYICVAWVVVVVFAQA